MSRKIAPRLVLCGLGMAGIVVPLGCMANHVDPVDARLFLPPTAPDGADRSASTKTNVGNAITAGDIEPGPTTFESPKVASVLPEPPTPVPAPFNTIKQIEEIGSGPTTQPVAVQPGDPVAAPAAPPQSPPSTPELQGQGVYMTLGGVVARVNDVPIYANEVLAPLNKEFSVRARTMSVDDFRYYARKEIYLRLKERIEDEVDFASAYNALSDDDRKLAEIHTMMDRHDRVIAAGGSVEVARQQAVDQGLDFDEVIRKDYRELVFYLYKHRHIEPQIQVSADNMRQFYLQNLDKFYHEKEQAQYRVIQVDPVNYKDAAVARKKIEALRDKAAKGQDFAVMASTENDDTLLKELQGSPCGTNQWMDRNSYAVDAVDAAVWMIEPGQITPVIEAHGKLYIAKLEAKRGGVTHPFDDQTVQADIYLRLRQQQLSQFWQVSKDASAVEATVSTDPQRVEVAVEMAMQKYAQTQVASGQ